MPAALTVDGLSVDFDGFKAVNDALGHDAGDELLKLAGKRMEGRLRHTDTLARLGGDEFVVVLEEIANADDAARIVKSIVEQLSTAFQLTSGKEVRIGASAGISLFPANGNDAETLIRNADAALYQAKAAGRGTWRYYGLDS